MARKTIDVATLVNMVNTRLAFEGYSKQRDGESPEQTFRRGVASLLEQVLHATGNYNGFQYVHAGGEQVYPFVKGETDESRRRYYPPKTR